MKKYENELMGTDYTIREYATYVKYVVSDDCTKELYEALQAILKHDEVTVSYDYDIEAFIVRVEMGEADE